MIRHLQKRWTSSYSNTCVYGCTFVIYTISENRRACCKIWSGVWSLFWLIDWFILEWSLESLLESFFWSQFWSVFFLNSFQKCILFHLQNGDYNLLSVEGIIWRIDSSTSLTILFIFWQKPIISVLIISEKIRFPGNNSYRFMTYYLSLTRVFFFAPQIC
jgi:hypothetical protein